jgi:C4-dicarboxylate transporter, DctM subunit
MILYISVGLLGLLSLTIPVGIVLFLLGIGIDQFFTPFPLLRGMGQMIWSASNSSTLIAIPFFVLLGEVLVRGGVAAKTYAALDKWLLAAGRADPRQYRHGDDVLGHLRLLGRHRRDGRHGRHAAGREAGLRPALFSGAIAAGGTLGIMIPPSINLIVYGFLTETSIPQLFLAGLIPGLVAGGRLQRRDRADLHACARTGRRAARLPLRRDAGGLRPPDPDPDPLRRDRRLDLRGWATPTEAAAVGVGMAFPDRRLLRAG